MISPTVALAILIRPRSGSGLVWFGQVSAKRAERGKPVARGLTIGDGLVTRLSQIVTDSHSVPY